MLARCFRLLEVVTQDGESMYVTSFIIPVELKIPETEKGPDYVEGTGMYTN